MRKILITGAKSYIGTSFERYINDFYPDDFVVDVIDLVDNNWRNGSFEGYDSVIHVAGIAHQKETNKNAQTYYRVNRDLAIEVAKKAKTNGVKQFVFLSSMSVYGLDTGIITRDSVPNPKTNYGKSKWQAEQEIISLEDASFHICVLRPPMVYGNGCKGNFAKIKRIVEVSPIFPNVKNQRSMIYVDNLSSFVVRCVERCSSGIYFPQNEEYMRTVDLAKGIGEALGKKIYFDYITGALVKILSFIHPTVRKAFGSLIYAIEDDMDYCVVSKADSIKRSILP